MSNQSTNSREYLDEDTFAGILLEGLGNLPREDAVKSRISLITYLIVQLAEELDGLTEELLHYGPGE